MTTINLTSETLFNFPCDYHIKVLGKDCEALQRTIYSIVERYTDKLHPNQITKKHSSKGNYMSFSIHIIASSRIQLDAINQDLQDCHLVSYVL
ncbi:protein of unknown function DUF493 [Candidatus Ruthia magnifica str. Cm (Calyptogena magnifica)]|uniref:UPF0250 protein Rmag_0541 n=1 Tax=Ruthia magnifica subsp. Calyptogena magnifica TaxID=413404 RepID=Y541_RUTMC|nr:DUF493 domain-containing protein [Candidatus Ruthturnera calyptogenae]A1AWI6.1 RecName: Full=UPF0250 protein Rmag_0541 [Candidatus Ruthia magnifica str. Cm (Calyptogena magnifica)]ABL02293.1 protein of unknown function DUF493 [Candidatus Ruthia magnifica str. Cm (Calyptogena magnifica)]